MNVRLSKQVTDLGNSIIQINKDHENMGTGGGGVNLFGLSTAALAATGLGAYLLLRKK